MSVLRAGINAVRFRLRVIQAIRILELERTRRRMMIAGLILSFYLANGILILLYQLGLVTHGLAID